MSLQQTIAGIAFRRVCFHDKGERDGDGGGDDDDDDESGGCDEKIQLAFYHAKGSHAQDFHFT